MKRDASIELYRCILTFGICLLHCIGLVTPVCAYIQRILMPCVVGFVFVTGWFGVNLKITKLLRLFTVAISCSIMTWIVDNLLLDGAGYGNGYNVLTWTRQWWFLNSYVMLLFFTPVLNCIIECLIWGGDKTRVSAILSVCGILFCTYIIGFVAYQFNIVLFSRNIACFFSEPCSFAVFCGIYVVGRFLKILNFLNNITSRGLVVGAIVGGLGCISGFHAHNSPFPLLLSISVFGLVRKVVLPTWLKHVVSFVAPSTFSIYLIHSVQPIGFVLIGNYEHWLLGLSVPLPLTWLIGALTVFTVSFFLDLPRRIIGICTKKKNDELFRCVDLWQEHVSKWALRCLSIESNKR